MPSIARCSRGPRPSATISTHAADELRALDPAAGRGDRLAEPRQIMMNAEQFAEALAEAEDALSRATGPSKRASMPRLRKLERRRDQAGGRLDRVCEALDRVLAGDGRSTAGDRPRRSARFAFDPRELEQSEERLFALRAAARKHKCTVDDLAKVRERLEGELQAIGDGGTELARLERPSRADGEAFDRRRAALSAKRAKAARSAR